MGCGCEPNPYVSTIECAAMCAICPERADIHRDDGRITLCSVSMKPVVHHASSKSCPLGSFPDTLGACHWLGVRWMGVPAPIRWAASTRLGRLAMGSIPKLPPFSGCGCIVSLRKLWDRIAPKTAPPPN